MDTHGEGTDTGQIKKKFWRGYTSTEKMTAINIGLVALYSILTAALCVIASLQYGAVKTDERPWIRVMTDRVQISPSITISTHALNSGKSPARSFKANFFVEVVKTLEDPKLDSSSPKKVASFSTGVLFPNDPADMLAPYTFTQSEY